MLQLNIVLEMVQQLGSTILTQPQHILSFIAHALEPPPSKKDPHRRDARAPKTAGGGLGINDLRIVEVDSDDEDEDSGQGLGELEDDNDDVGDGMIFTSVNLLLSILEGQTFYSYRPVAFELTRAIFRLA